MIELREKILSAIIDKSSLAKLNKLRLGEDFRKGYIVRLK